MPPATRRPGPEQGTPRPGPEQGTPGRGRSRAHPTGAGHPPTAARIADLPTGASSPTAAKERRIALSGAVGARPARGG
ncbi:hypothetical protein PQR15_19455 [Streptomyces lydicus]|nr:hypothetical protein [Streptomyces lydicus]